MPINLHGQRNRFLMYEYNDRFQNQKEERFAENKKNKIHQRKDCSRERKKEGKKTIKERI